MGGPFAGLSPGRHAFVTIGGHDDGVPNPTLNAFIMFHLKTKWLALLGGALIATGSAFAQDSGPLIDLLVKKGIVTDQEAEDLRAELVKDFATSSAGKVNLATTETELKISGDVRVRYEDRTADVAGDEIGRDRLRYRLRLGLAGKMLNNWGWGVRIETATGSRSSNVTMGDDAAGPFAKNSDGLFVGQAWINNTPTADLTFTTGLMANPLVSTQMVWDADINPEGFAEQWKHRYGQIEYSATFAQFLYNAANTQKAIGIASRVQDLGLFAYQGGVKVYTNELATSFFQANPTFYQYINEQGSSNPAPFKGNFSPSNIFGINNLFVFDLPMEYDWVTGGGVPLRIWGDYAVNLDGDQRAAKYGTPDLKNESDAYLIGFQYGKAGQQGLVGCQNRLRCRGCVRPRSEPGGLRYLGQPHEHEGLGRQLQLRPRCGHAAGAYLRQWRPQERRAARARLR